MNPIEPFPSPLSLTRTTTSVLPLPDTVPSFLIGRANKSYKHQYANIYFIRLRLLRPFVEREALQKWMNLAGNPDMVPRVLDVVKNQLCYVIGTVYMDMPLKPNVMEDIARDHSIPPPPPPPKFYSKDDNVMLEDESGRIRLVGERVIQANLVTGVIIAALGIETPEGDFEVADLCYAGMAPQGPSDVEDGDSMDVDDANVSPDEWIGVVSGLDVGALSPSDAQIQMLVEYLTGEGGGVDEQLSASQISRLIIAGDSLAAVSPLVRGESVPILNDRKAKRYGHDQTTFSPHPIQNLSASLLDIARTMPIHILPGDTDPSGTILPQQPFPRAMFGDAAKIPTFTCETNPTYLKLSTDGADGQNLTRRPRVERTLLINSGQPLNDMFKYLPTPPNSRLSILESTLKWRHMAPTAPDTLWCHPYFAADPFLLTETPNLYIVGGQKKFATRLVSDQNATKKQTQCRIVMVPSFAQTGILVLVNLRSLDVKRICFAVEGMASGGEESNRASSARPPSPTPEEPLLSAPKSSANSGTM